MGSDEVAGDVEPWMVVADAEVRRLQKGALVCLVSGLVAVVGSAIYLRVAYILNQAGPKPNAEGSISVPLTLGIALLVLPVALFWAGWFARRAQGGRRALKQQLHARDAFVYPATKAMRGEDGGAERQWAVYWSRPSEDDKPVAYAAVSELNVLERALYTVEIIAGEQLTGAGSLWIIAGDFLLQSSGAPTPGEKWRDDVPVPKGDPRAIPDGWSPTSFVMRPFVPWAAATIAVVALVVGLLLARGSRDGPTHGLIALVVALCTGFVAVAAFWQSRYPIRRRLDPH